MSPDCYRSEGWSVAARTVCSVWRMLLCSVWRMLLEQHPSPNTVRAATLQPSDLQQSGDIIPNAVSESLAFLKMGKELPETCWANFKINKLLLLHLVGPLLYLCRWCRSNTHQIQLRYISLNDGTSTKIWFNMCSITEVALSSVSGTHNIGGIYFPPPDYYFMTRTAM